MFDFCPQGIPLSRRKGVLPAPSAIRVTIFIIFHLSFSEAQSRRGSPNSFNSYNWLRRAEGS
ncbi:MAG: hypothetical protein ACI3ZJ_07795 [Bacteroidaceae bacterium]